MWRTASNGPRVVIWTEHSGRVLQIADAVRKDRMAAIGFSGQCLRFICCEHENLELQAFQYDCSFSETTEPFHIHPKGSQESAWSAFQYIQLSLENHRAGICVSPNQEFSKRRPYKLHLTSLGCLNDGSIVVSLHAPKTTSI